MELQPRLTKHYIKDALNNERLRSAVDRATATSVQKRDEKVAEVPYWEELRHRAHSIKRQVIENLDIYLEAFETNAQKNGVHVHWAADDEKARQIIIDIAKENDVETIVKSKSLTTEEIYLNSFLIENGFETLETDLGEYIVQLMDQIPSHLTAPALHLDRKDIGNIFHEKLGVDYTEEPSELLAIARHTLREKFLKADMGISGVNFGIADSGCFCVVENEANARLTVGLPKVHVAVMGMEKLLPSFKELGTFLKLLPSSATGQKQSVYVDVVGGALRQQLGEGPENVHIVILDNGRSKILADPQLRESLFCIRCGACLNICPIYQQVGGHAYGWVYMGPIGATLISQYLGNSEGRYSPFVSSLCGACYQQCPVRINLPHHLLKLRNQIVDDKKTGRLERTGIKMHAFMSRHPKLYRFLTWFPGKFQQLLPKKMAFPAPGYTKHRQLGRFDSKGFRKRFSEMQDSKK